jgi:hypothetical protein
VGKAAHGRENPVRDVVFLLGLGGTTLRRRNLHIAGDGATRNNIGSLDIGQLAPGRGGEKTDRSVQPGLGTKRVIHGGEDDTKIVGLMIFFFVTQCVNSRWSEINP